MNFVLKNKSGWVGLGRGFLCVLVICFVFLLLKQTPVQGEVDEYVPLAIEQVPGFENASDPTSIVGNIYNISIGLGAILAVIMIIWSGVRYTVSEAVGGKEDAMDGIQKAILGLLLLLGSYIILRTINVDITNVNLRLDGESVTTGGAFDPATDNRQHCFDGAEGRECFTSSALCNQAREPKKDFVSPCSPQSSPSTPSSQYCYVGGEGDSCFTSMALCNQAREPIKDFVSECSIRQ